MRKLNKINMNTKNILVFLFVASFSLFAGSLMAATLDTDNASASAYSSGWDTSFGNWALDGTTSTGGGFGGWGLSVNPNAALSVASVASLGGSSLLDTGGKSFRLSGGWYDTGGGVWSGAYSGATRFLDPAGLDVGQSFSFQMAVNYRNGAKGVNLYDTTGAQILNFNVGGDDYKMNTVSIGASYSNDTVFSFLLAQTSAGGGTWSITRSGGVTDLDTGTYTGILRSANWYAGGTDNNSSDALFVNSLSIVPEPSALSLLIGGGALLLALRNRKRTALI
ncbi:MAG: PEP-CTERM sorting domain-containing protein [Verrucomicrobia bacterium]|nr:PEP-CTERM sorting domain-containing protein [Verrucomicrobiota bacterium]